MKKQAPTIDSLITNLIEPDIILNADQAAAFASGEMLYIKNADCEVLGAVSHRILGDSLPIAEHMDSIHEASAMIELISSALTDNGHEYLELNPKEKLGLNCIFDVINQRLLSVPL